MTQYASEIQRRTDAELADPWQGPMLEKNALGGTTGEWVVRCKFCRVEVLTCDKEHATHQEACPL